MTYYYHGQVWKHYLSATNVFIPVCDSVHGGRGVYTFPWQTPLGRHPPRHLALEQTPPPPWADTLPPLGRHPCEMATAADGTHPAGMHSCTWFCCKSGTRCILYRDPNISINNADIRSSKMGQLQSLNQEGNANTQEAAWWCKLLARTVGAVGGASKLIKII